jgi:2'-5' RNA ligase
MIETKVRFGLRYRRARKKLNGSFKALFRHGVRLEIFEVDEFQHGRMCCLKINRRRPAVIERALPASNANTPAVTGFQPGKTPFRHRRHEIVAIEHRKIEKLLGDFDTDRVKSEILGTGAAITVPVKSSQRITTAATEVGSENVGWHGGMVLKERTFPNRYCWRIESLRGKFAMDEEKTIIAYWLLPAEPARSELAGIISDLAKRFDAPSFEPHVTVYVTEADRQNAADVLRRVLREHQPFRLSVRGIEYSDKFTKTLFIQFAADAELSRCSDELRRASTSASDYQLNPHLSLIYKAMAHETQRDLAAAITLPFAEISFDEMKAIVSPAEIKDRGDVEAWRVVAEGKLRS